MVQYRGLQWCDVLDRRNSVWLVLQVLILQGLLQPAYGEFAKRFLCGFQCLTSSCYTCFWHFSSWYVHYVHFILTSGCWEVLDSEKCLFGNLGASKGKRPQYNFLSRTVCEKKEAHSNYRRAHRSCEFHSWTPGTSNTCFFPAKFWKLQSVCAHVIPTWARFHNVSQSYIEFQLFVISHAIYDHHNHYFFLLGVSRLLVGALGRSLFLIAGVCKGVRRMKKSSETRAQAVAAQQTWKIVFNILNQI